MNRKDMHLTLSPSEVAANESSFEDLARYIREKHHCQDDSCLFFELSSLPPPYDWLMPPAEYWEKEFRPYQVSGTAETFIVVVRNTRTHQIHILGRWHGKATEPFAIEELTSLTSDVDIARKPRLPDPATFETNASLVISKFELKEAIQTIVDGSLSLSNEIALWGCMGIGVRLVEGLISIQTLEPHWDHESLLQWQEFAQEHRNTSLSVSKWV